MSDVTVAQFLGLTTLDIPGLREPAELAVFLDRSSDHIFAIQTSAIDLAATDKIFSPFELNVMLSLRECSAENPIPELTQPTPDQPLITGEYIRCDWQHVSAENAAKYPELVARHASHGPGNMGDCDTFFCVSDCGNTVSGTGFGTCSPEGVEMEPDKNWAGHYRCGDCGRVIDGTTGKVVARITDAEPIELREAPAITAEGGPPPGQRYAISGGNAYWLDDDALITCAIYNEAHGGQPDWANSGEVDEGRRDPSALPQLSRIREALRS